MKLSVKNELILEITFKNANVYVVDGNKAVVIEASGIYISIEEFQSILGYVADLVIKYNIQKLVFDKRELKIFHQPSMEWYFVEWKEKMYGYGLKTHRKILPQSPIFRESVKIGRAKINENYPDKKFHEMDIQYVETLEEAVNN